MKFTLALAALGVAASASADMPQVQPGRFRCAPNGVKVRNQEIVPLKTEQELRIAFRMIQQNSDSKRPATAAISLTGSTGFTRIIVGQSLSDQFRMYAALETPGMKQQILYEFPLTKNWIILNLTHDVRGYLTVRNNDVEQRFPVGTPAFSNTFVLCQRGEWEIDVWPRLYGPVGN